MGGWGCSDPPDARVGYYAIGLFKFRSLSSPGFVQPLVGILLSTALALYSLRRLTYVPTLDNFSVQCALLPALFSIWQAVKRSFFGLRVRGIFGCASFGQAVLVFSEFNSK